MELVDQPAVVERALGVVRVTGQERLAYLHTQLSQHLDGLEPGRAADFLYLDAKGNARAMGRAVAVDDAVLLAVPAELAAWLAETLAKYTFLMQASAEVAEGWACASARGPGRVEVADAPDEPMTAAIDGDLVVVRDRSGGVDWLGPRDRVEAAMADSGLPTADAEAWEAWRVLAGEPAWGTEVAAGRRPQELGLLPTHVHLRKGCYPGQESIAKTYNLGRPRRTLCVARFEGSVQAGAAVEVGGKQGEVTSAAPLDAGSAALCLLPLDRDGELLDTAVTVDGLVGEVLRRVGEGMEQPGAV